MTEQFQELRPPSPPPSQILGENACKHGASVLKPAPLKLRPRRLSVSPQQANRGAPSDLGGGAEETVVRTLNDLGWRLVERNFRRRQGEIDIIALDGETLVFLEVKARSGEDCGHGAEALTTLKKSRIRRTALAFLAKHPHQGPIRFDVVYLDAETNQLEHLQDAFPG